MYSLWAGHFGKSTSETVFKRPKFPFKTAPTYYFFFRFCYYIWNYEIKSSDKIQLKIIVNLKTKKCIIDQCTKTVSVDGRDFLYFSWTKTGTKLSISFYASYVFHFMRVSTLSWELFLRFDAIVKIQFVYVW